MVASIPAALSVASSVSGLMGGSGGNTAGGQYYDPFASHRGTYANKLNQMMLGTGGGQQAQPQQARGQPGTGGGSWQLDPSKISSDSYAIGDALGPNNSTWVAAQQPTQAYGNAGGSVIGQQANAGNPVSNFMSSDPSYMWRLSQGESAANRAAAQGGLLNSGARLTSLNDYAQNQASTEFGNEFNRLAMLSGATQGPIGVADTSKSNWSGLAQGMAGVQNLFSNQGGGGFSSGADWNFLNALSNNPTDILYGGI
ncbi:hypothetical protein UFOVP67_19 [uncultured Caudovirales phage]|uniref:Uncharacterized protein n=1 Tax=uncultured Caudovirales phage TaxID=2100421 RepID=A0A6J5TCD7_9CAUD|nr:hypothetical protein UFOVP67_19 [uncultured Caudovirales phage]